MYSDSEGAAKGESLCQPPEDSAAALRRLYCVPLSVTAGT